MVCTQHFCWNKITWFDLQAADFSAAAAAAPPVHARVETPSNEADAPTSPYIQGQYQN
jgi:hypothetical protein